MASARSNVLLVDFVMRPDIDGNDLVPLIRNLIHPIKTLLQKIAKEPECHSREGENPLFFSDS